MLYSSEEARTNELGSIEQHRPLQSKHVILHLEQTAGPGFQKLQENTKHGLFFRSFYSTTAAESYITKEPSQTNEANMPEKVALSLKIKRIRKTDAQEVNTKHVAKVACPIIHYTETNL